jgi:shikimate dehydrogenase
VKAVNWLGLDDAGRVVGDNTDVEGFTRALGEAGIAAGVPLAVVLGGGGAARAAAYALAREGAKRVIVGARREAQARELAADIRRPEIEGRDLEFARAEAPNADLVVSTVPASGWHAVAPASMKGTLVDVAYDPRATPAETWARERGLRAIGGLGMLLHQGALSFERWLKVPFPMAAARAALTS